MSEIYPSVRASIRRSVLEALYERPGAWLSTHDLLELVEEAESSGVLARILSDMATTGRLEIGPKVTNAHGRACNTWGLSPEWRANLAEENDPPAPAGQAEAAPPLPAESSEDAPPAPLISGPADSRAPAPVAAIQDYQALQSPFASIPEADAAAETRQAALPMSDLKAHGLPPAWTQAEADQPSQDPQPSQTWKVVGIGDKYVASGTGTPPCLPLNPPKLDHPSHDARTEIRSHPLPERWLPELRLRLQAIDGGSDPEIILRINTEGGGAYMTLSTHGKIAFDPGELDFLPAVGTALCQIVDALYPYGTTRPTAAATTPSAPEPQA